MFDGCGKQFGRIDGGLLPEERLGNFAFHPALQLDHGRGNLSAIRSIKEYYHTCIRSPNAANGVPSR
jgi:hypothetical protein